ncbi:HD domain-containing protein [Brevibacillus sp. SYP-B805]|uniref:HD domain-containing phosphohydrolase n=1 Tax=Brevibacillus sp. SYP-B805 TaxID=1578199 RepID=UPI0013EB6415|nr:HD domain-containing phosphohydrolase [Brevibacillus sp. SYP-B805]NGQ94906.1 HD domain-containing protein [Brevibacillus sp. SYP-B805]
MPRILNSYLYTVFALGMAVLFCYFPKLNPGSLLAVMILAIIAGFMEKYLVELPNGTLFSGAAIFTFTALLCYGLPEAMMVEVVVVLSSTVFDRVQLSYILFNIGQFVLSIAAAGNTYLWLGGTPGSFAWSDLPHFLAALLVYNLVNSGLVFVALSHIQNKNYFVLWYDSLQDIALIYTVTFSLGLRLVLTFRADNQTQFWIEAIFIFFIFLALRYAFRLFIELRKTYLTSMESFTNITEDKLSISVGHATRVGRLARQIAEELKLSQTEIDAIHYAALFHDLGKVQVKDSIYKKRGPRTLEEEKEHRKHVEISAEMVKEISGLEKAAEFVLYHHEQWDGRGYPTGKKGEEIPLGARIIAAANEYDHVLYHAKGKNPKSEYAKLADNKLDPRLVKLVMKIADFHIETEETAQVDNQVEVVGPSLSPSGARIKIYQSKLLQKIGACLLAVYDDTFRNGKGEPIDIPLGQHILPLVKRAREQHVQVREFVEDTANGKVYDVYCVPYRDVVYLSLFDASTIIDYEQKQEERIKLLYRDVIYSVTQGKMLLSDDQEIAQFYRSELLAEVPITAKKDVAICRDQVSKHLDRLGVPEKMKFSILLCTSEAATNVLKHAIDGRMKLFVDEPFLRVIVEDNGSGIELSEIPKSTLMTGYSSKVSMGHGFSLMLKLMNRVVLSTGPQGTTVVLEAKLDSDREAEPRLSHAPHSVDSLSSIPVQPVLRGGT